MNFKKMFMLAIAMMLSATVAHAVDTVSSTTIRNTDGRYSFLFGNASDGTGETAAVKVTAAPLVSAPTNLIITKLKWAISGMSVSVLFDASSDDRVAILTGNGEMNEREDGPIKDPQSSGHTGNILFTTNIATTSVKGSYTVYMECRKVN